MEEDKKAEEVYRTFPERFGDLALEITSKWDVGKDTLPRILKGALETLRHNIENPDDLAVSWESPWIEAHYPVEWDWERGGIVPPYPETLPESIVETLRKGEDPFEKNPEELHALAVKCLSRSGQVLFLQAITHGIAVHIKDQKVEGFFFLDPEIKDELDALPEKEREERLDHYREPFNLGGVPWMDEDGSRYILAPLEKDGGDFLPDELRKALENVSRLTFEGEVNGVAHRGGVVFVIDPLQVNEDKKEVFYPVTVGLVFVPSNVSLTTVAIREDDFTGELEAYAHNFFPEVNPSTWPEEDRKRLWEILLEELPQKVQESFDKDAAEEEVEGLVPAAAVAPSPERRHLLNGTTRISKSAALVKSSMRRLRLPRKMADVKPWGELVEERIKRIREDYKDEAFRDLRRETGDPNVHGPLLERRWKNGAEVVELTREAREELLAEVGPKGYRDRVQDPDGLFREYVIKRFPVRGGAGYIEARLSWYGTTWPLVEEGRKQKKEEWELVRRSLPSLPFEGLQTKEREVVNSYLRTWESIRDAYEVMDLILHRFGHLGENPVRLHVWELKSILKCESDSHRFRRIRGAIRALQELRFSLKVTREKGLPQEIEGPFIKGSATLTQKGKGAHTDGYFELEISEPFVGCLRVFRVDGSRIRDPRRIYDWGKILSKEEKKELRKSEGYVKRSALAPFLDLAEGLTDQQKNLHFWINENITLKKDPTRKKGPHVRIRSAAKDADEPRLYGRETCPLLPEGQLFHGALGHYQPRPEQGRRLFGTPTRGSEKSGGHAPGLLLEMGYQLPAGAAAAKRKDIVKKALQDLHVVVEQIFEGIVAGKRGDHWLTLKEAEDLPPVEILKSISWFIFLPTTWHDKIPAKINAYFKKRHESGETPYQVTVTEDRRLVDAEISEEAVGLENEPPWIRLYTTRNERKLTQAAVGDLFGVSQQIVAGWEKGPEKGKAIPEDVVPLLLRWIENGPAPTEEEMAVLKARRAVRPGKAKA
jgi:DNA-binding transcriptional regulator YiaG